MDENRKDILCNFRSEYVSEDWKNEKAASHSDFDYTDPTSLYHIQR